jgi:AcrR family transcriptional regulator
MMQDPKRPGRPRDKTLDEEIRRAVFELIEEVGLGRTTIEEIAHRAGVSKATIYRRWDSKEELIVDTLAGLVGLAVEVREVGDIREEMLTDLRLMHTFISDSTAGAVMPWLAGEMARNSEIGRRYIETLILPRRRLLANRIRNAIERGELRSDLDVEVAVDMLTGPLVLRKLLHPTSVRPPDWAEKLVDALLDGWRPT